MTLQPSHKLRTDAFGVYAKEPYRLLAFSFDEPLDGYENTVTFHVCDQTDVTWNGVHYARMPFEIRGEGLSADQEVARPTLMMPNEDRRFSYYAERGLVEGAHLTLYEVHPDEMNTRQARVRTYLIARVKADNELQITFELRTPSDGPNYQIPARRFIAPEFPSVKL